MVLSANDRVSQEMTDKGVGGFRGQPPESGGKGDGASWHFLGPVQTLDHQREWVLSLQGLRREAGCGAHPASSLNILCGLQTPGCGLPSSEMGRVGPCVQVVTEARGPQACACFWR